MSLGRMKVGRHGEPRERERERGVEEKDCTREGGGCEGCERRAKENAAALPANSRRPAIFTRPIK